MNTHEIKELLDDIHPAPQALIAALTMYVRRRIFSAQEIWIEPQKISALKTRLETN